MKVKKLIHYEQESTISLELPSQYYVCEFPDDLSQSIICILKVSLHGQVLNFKITSGALNNVKFSKLKLWAVYTIRKSKVILIDISYFREEVANRSFV